ncbi:GNAT family N-acetyltransferase [Streptomyces sp. TRM76323]|uniref:GNAT family N-acetyltransferase n=1 Tax=Streptomyces tamarix TaxID=3078565 RepID=A0ABU3QEJ9_9ACTN|nr:GNAT family N-acetyltransferase [Streptomyces tamarix]MDT9681195.1 GNAT family N-acetyltransferase [Streptomyces tamarix]
MRLVEITPDNVLEACALRVRPGQEGFVAPVARSPAEAYASPDVARPRLVYDGDRLVAFVRGFFGVRFDPDDPRDRPRSGPWRPAVSAGHQGRGYGRFAVGAVCEEVRRRGGSRVTVSWKPGGHGPEGFSTGLGFRPTGGVSGDQVVAELDLGPAAQVQCP